MLYAAGLAEGRRGRSAWAATCGALAAVAFGLGAWGATERGERRNLAARLERPSAVSTNAIASSPEFTGERSVSSAPSPKGLFALRKKWENDPDSLLAMSNGPGANGGPPSPQEMRILKADWRNDPLPH
jgi:hypothetical protein